MKAEIKNETPENKFPCLMQNPASKNVFLITGIGKYEDIYEGTCVYSKNKHEKIGQHSITWDRKSLIPFEGSITLSNN